jgi:hypothetical protein
MGKPRTPSKLISYLLAGAIALLIAGCGGGAGGDVEEQTATSANRTSETVARTGPIVAVRVGQTAILSDNNSFTTLAEPLTFRWSFASRPDGSNAVLSNPTSKNPSFVADARGSYRVQLVVSAGSVSSARAVQLVVATVSPERLTGPFFHQGLSSNCLNCHNDDFITIPGKSRSHIATSNMCETCHTPLGWPITPQVDHLEVFGDCSGCHNGVLAVGKSEFHPQTNAECDECHNTASFLALEPDGSFDHTGISRTCSGCHNGIVSRGKTPTLDDTPPGTHPVTTSECGFCHTTTSFLGAYPDHSGPAVVGPGITCDSCHGVSAVGQPNGHPITAVDCDVCHSIVSFDMGGIFNHRLVEATLQSCESCHNPGTSINAPAKTPTPPHPSTSDDCGTCHNTESFADAIFDHSGIVSDCGVACHIADGSGTARGMPPSTPTYAHMPTALDCSSCHTPGTFATGTYDHAGVTMNCTNCHNDVISAGKPFHHIPTTPDSQDCADCHFSTTTFSGAIFSHAGISGNCVSCHDGNISTGKAGSHIPTTQDCIACHSTSAPFKPALNFAHVGISGNCESCHNGSPDYVAAGAIGKKPNHIPAINQCSQCHNDTSTGGFASSTFLATLHPGISNGCEGCHIDQFFPADPTLTKAAGHLPTAQDCDVCHTVAGFQPSTFAHLDISGNCASCHDGSPGFVALGARGKTPSPPHPATSSDCVVCHNTTTFADAFVDHTDPAVLAVRCDSCHNGSDAIGKIAKPNHVPTTEDCSVCHTAGGAFKPAVFNHDGIVDNCASCHNGTAATGTSAKTNPPHIPITQDCSACHTPTAFANARFEHEGIVDNCGTCHDGFFAQGKHNNHVPTNGDCVDCHQTTGFRPASFDHVGIVDNCASCHAVGFATPKKAGHVETSQDCGVCHTTSGFIPATFDHTGIVSNCESCHDGNTAKGKVDAVPTHLATSLDCSSCHTTATFVGGSWTHDAGSANNCDTCHNGSDATGKINAVPTHLSTTEQCDVCHTTNGWAPTIFSHDPNGNYPGDHRRNPGCNACHGPTISATIPWPFAQYAPFCAACHANDFEREGSHIGGSNGTVEQNKNCGGSGCHRVSASEF